MIRSAGIFRSASGFSEMNSRAVLDVPPPVKSVHCVNRRVGGDNIDHRQQDLVHGLKRSVLVGLNRSLNPPVVLLREKSLGHANEQVNVQPDGGQQHQPA